MASRNSVGILPHGRKVTQAFSFTAPITGLSPWCAVVLLRGLEETSSAHPCLSQQHFLVTPSERTAAKALL